MKGKVTYKGIWEVLKNSINGFIEHKITRMSGALAYYTVFSMAPLLMLIISLCAMFLSREAVEGQIYTQLVGFMGNETAKQLQEIIQNAAVGNKEKVAFIISIVTLLIGATTVFAEMQDSINDIWGLKPKPKRGWLKILKNRFLSFSVIISLVFILLVSLTITTLLDEIGSRLRDFFPDLTLVVFYILNQLFTLIIVSFIFAVIFKMLPDAEIKWKDVFSGALATAVLFMAGKLAISFYINQSDVVSIYGTTASLVVLLLWTYYSSIILYFGAEFTKAFAMKYGSEIYPSHYAVTTKQIEIETGGQSVQQKDK